MIGYKYADLYKQERVIKHVKIEYEGGLPITCNEMHEEEFELTEYLCSTKPFRFGACEACFVKFKISNVVVPLKDKWLKVAETLGENSDVSFSFGEYKVRSDMPTADRRYRDIVAYDAMYDILNADVAAWFNTILPDKNSTVTLKEFRSSFIAHFGIEQEEVELVNDSMIVTKTIEPSELSGKMVITAICEINGCFGHIGRDGKFQYIHLKEMKEGVYPSDTLYPRDDLYPSDPMNVTQISKSYYSKATYQDYTTACINKLQIRQEEGDIGYIYGTGSNCYIVEGNFLVYGKSSEELRTIAANLYSVISKVWYRPAHVEAKGNPCLEVGDGIKLSTQYEIIYTYILQRTLKGIQALRDTYDAEGEQYQREDVNSVHKSILQLKGKTNTLTRTIEETKSEIIDIEKGLSSRITQNADSITAEVKRATEAEGNLSALLKIEADKITAEVKRATEAEGSLSAALKIEADKITAEVKRATDAELTLSSRITLTEKEISLRVSKGSIISEINQTAEKITIKANKIDLEGLVEADEFLSKLVEAEKLKSNFATIKVLEVEQLRIDNVESEIDTVKSNYVQTETLTSDYATITSVTSLQSYIEDLLTKDMQLIGYFGLGPLSVFTYHNKTIDLIEVNGKQVLGVVDGE